MMVLGASAAFRDTGLVRQLGLFSKAELDSMRDDTKVRHESEETLEFRRLHEIRRDWGLQQRHATKLRRIEQQRMAGAYREALSAAARSRALRRSSPRGPHLRHPRGLRPDRFGPRGPHLRLRCPSHRRP
jgi:hypothetical protein